MRRLLPYLVAALSLWAAAVPCKAQERKDSTVTLVSADRGQLVTENGQDFRKAVGHVRFLHNDTYLLCDSALWNVSTGIIDAIGHVQIIQDRTRLTSNTLQYVIDDNLAKFRGAVVQLEDKDRNTLRTKYLDYNTKDSVAIFQNGASMRDKDGQIIESRYGSYDSKARLFVFNDQVNMYMDTTFVKTSRLEYRSDLSTAYFGYGTDMWQDDNMLSANDGWYDRNKELFFFRRNVHLLTKDQESWSDTLYYHRPVNDVEMMGNVELMDTTRNVFGLAGRVDYTDSLSRVKMTRTPAVMNVSEEKGRRDTLYFGADTILYRGIKRNKVDSLWTVSAKGRLKDLEGDPVTEYRRKAAEEAAKAAEEAARKQAAGTRDRGPGGAAPPTGGLPGKGADPQDRSAPPVMPMDTTASSVPTDSVAAPAEVDSTQLSFLWGINHVKLYRDDMQMSCDSLVYNDLDSLFRLYRDPLVFSDGNRQYAADSIYVVVRNRKAERARLMGNAFITTEEAVDCYDQIRGAEMMAYFDTTRTLTRFDALGGATALFFLQENDALATVNKVESKMLYALFDKGNLDKVYYFQEAKNDAYPVVQLPREERYMKGFRWDPERRPDGKGDITPLVPRKSQRLSYLARPHAQFKETEIYFPGHIKKIYREIAERDSMAVVRSRQLKETPVPEVKAPVAADTLATPADTLVSSVDTLGMPALPVDNQAVSADSLGRSEKGFMPEDALPEPKDSAAALPDPIPDKGSVSVPEETSKLDPLSAKKEAEKAAERARKAEEKRQKEEQRRLKAEEKARLDAQKQAEREARWAEEDKIYEEKQAVRAQKKLEKERQKKLRALRKLEKKAQKERRIFERYLEKERAKADKKAAREAEKARKAAEKAAEKAASKQ